MVKVNDWCSGMSPKLYFPKHAIVRSAEYEDLVAHRAGPHYAASCDWDLEIEVARIFKAPQQRAVRRIIFSFSGLKGCAGLAESVLGASATRALRGVFK
jgi:hypothetical protein